MLTAAATALTRTDDTAGVVLVGGAVTLLAWVLTPAWLVGVLFVSPAVAAAAPVALAPWLVARGYFVRVTRSAIQTGEATGTPSLVAWGELVRDGVKSVLLSAALLAPLAGGLAVAGGVVAALIEGPVDPAATATAVESALGPGGPAVVAVAAVGVVAALVGAYLLAFAYVRPAALAAFAASGRLRDGLSPQTVADIAATGPYATGWTLAAGALAVGYAVAAPTAPLVVGVALAFLVRVVAHGLYGRGAAAAMAGGPDSRTEPGVTEAHIATDAGGRALRETGATHGDVTARGDAATRGDAITRGNAAARGGTAAAEVGRGRDAPSVPAVSGDGGRPMRSEPPAAVQTGRTVPIEGGDDPADATAEVNADAAEPDGTDAEEPDAAGPDGGFVWGPRLSDAEDKS
ncbi:DUF4013 domain-containing protein [Halorubrum ezzemoulense]|uniref:DUF4013 domain-containing protein n=1 Tax=Halorubrum ezzemoulense TaxID=337243 RepID=UPI00232F63C3|nr:DUF4013 domain-containing protein [Halorubrum ezzemoulense]MDB2261115.1 DUF4013 domain-containing protein [Halorubrum ezzemoulense]MDB2267583.1 DUF4013 domain-containing protein [Halorubrum ezzemoulense]